MTTHIDKLDEILKVLKLAPPSRKIYTYLLTHGECSVRTISDGVSMTRPSVYDHLQILTTRGFVVEKEIENTAVFGVDDPVKLQSILEDEIDTLKIHTSTLKDIVPTLIQNGVYSSPVIKFYQGEKGLTHLLHDILHTKSKEIFTYWPYDTMLKILNPEMLKSFNEKRIRSKIKLHSIWPLEVKSKTEHIWSKTDDIFERRYTKLTSNMGYTIYGNKVSYISAENGGYGFIIHSEEFAHLMRIQFDLLWKDSAKRKIAN